MSEYKAVITGPDRLDLICRYHVAIMEDERELYSYSNYAITLWGAKWLANGVDILLNGDEYEDDERPRKRHKNSPYYKSSKSTNFHVHS